MNACGILGCPHDRHKDWTLTVAYADDFGIETERQIPICQKHWEVIQAASLGATILVTPRASRG